ncbi:MAG: SUMF1/EgtB/PvdO family nonheme iron enzyme [Planctomycetota bacterium]
MDLIAAIRELPPSSWEDFERLCADLWSSIWGAHAERHGRRGQNQQGVDVYGQMADGRWGGVQCKLKSRVTGRAPRLTEDEVVAEIAAAKTFRSGDSSLGLLILATTAPPDASAQAVERAHNDAKNRPFELQILGWDQIVDQLANHPAVARSHYGFLGLSEATRKKIHSYLETVWNRCLPLPSGPALGRDAHPPELPAVYTRLHVAERVDERAFEAFCHDYFRAAWDDDGAMLYGSIGRTQHGVDVLGSGAGAGRAGQCLAVRTLDRDVVRRAVDQAKTFHTPLAELTIATTAPPAADVQAEIDALNADPERPFDVQVRAWPDLVDAACRWPHLWRRHFPLFLRNGAIGSPLEVWEHLARHERVVLQGEGGSGKSAFARYLTLCLAGEALHEPRAGAFKKATLATLAGPEEGDRDPRCDGLLGGLIPVLIELRAFVASDAFPHTGTPNPNHLLAYIRNEWRLDSDVVAELQLMLAATPPHRGVMLVLDGLDEVANSAKIRTPLKQCLRAFLDAYPGCRVLVTTRPYAYRRPEWQLDPDLGFVETALQPFDADHVRRFAHAWFADAGRSSSVAEDFARIVLGHRHLARLGRRPLLLTLLAYLHDSGQVDLRHGDRGTVFREAVELLFDRWNQAREGVPSFADQAARIFGGPATEAATVEQRRAQVLAALRDLAFHAHGRDLDGDRKRVTVEDIWSALARHLSDPDDEEAEPNYHQLMNYLSRRSGLLLAVGEETPRASRYEFPHGSLQESLAAEYLVRLEGYPATACGSGLHALMCGDPNRWREVVGFCALHAPDRVWNLVDELVPLPGSKGPSAADQRLAIHASLAVLETRAHETARRHEQALLAQLLARLTSCLTDERLAAAERIEAGEALGVLGDERIGHWLENFREIEAGSDKLLGLYPVTVQEYAEFMKDGGYDTPEWWTHEGGAERRGHFGWSEPEGWEGQEAHGNRPVVGVSWDEAMAYCAWCSKCKEIAGYEARLPTAEEWQVAALAGDQPWPWGEEDPSPELANYGGSVGAPTPVGVYPLGRGRFGHWDLAGNVDEWCADEQGPSPRGPRHYGPRKAVRGGGWADSAEGLGHWFRGGSVRLAAYRSVNLGFRVLLSPASP